MKSLSIRNESPENLKDAKNATKQPSWSRLQEVTGKIEENSSWNTKAPNPQKAPLNYIENLGEWEATNKKYEEAIANKQLELAQVLSWYEDKQEELDRFKEAKSDLEIDLIKVMWSIANKLMEHNEFIAHIFNRIGINSEWNDFEEEAGSDVDEETESDKLVDVVETEKSKNDKLDGVVETEKPDYNKVVMWLDQIKSILSSAWLNIVFDNVSMGGDNTDDSESWDKEFFYTITSIIENFLEIVSQENWPKYKGLLNNDEIKQVDEIHSFVKEYCVKYLDLSYQIDIIDSKISQLDDEETSIGINYYNLKKEIEEMVKNAQELGETYFLNSYLSTKNVSFDDFVSTPLIEKQISHIIETNKKWLPIPKTILLYWKPNLWKTFAANVLASELWRPMYHIKSYDIFTWWFSDPNHMLDTIFNSVIKKKEPCIIFLDEIENFAQWYDGSPYSNLIENTIRHHVSKIKESNLDIIIIWAISEKIKVSPNLLKQDVFSKQIYFDTLPESRCADFINKIAQEDNITIWNDVDITKLVNNLKEGERNQEFLKKLINMAIDSHKLNDIDEDNIVLSLEDFEEALKYMWEYSRNIKGIWF